MPRTVTLTIPGTPAYSLSPNARCHWAVKQRETREARWATELSLRERLYDWESDEFTGPVRIAWTVYLPKGGKRRDVDNLVPCFKPYLDQLVTSGILPGDSPKWIPEPPKVEQVLWSQHGCQPSIDVTITEAATGGQDG